MSLKQTLYNHLMTGETISPLQALKLFNCMSLAQRLGELRRDDGIPIQSRLHHEPSGKKYGIYWLDKAYIAGVKAGKIKGLYGY
ncbi:helix-turn-helix domain-containing protein [Moraxella nasovis]|uniref:helix-turn-helix domain-containing protein n=1 Tax=Moraxella nasovis TaxID=2904121 RepID=UPI001F5FF71E|nr:helix-turn-helix domain-containing protein [Moraxella nasovis]UNU73648.1 helix-turn-helix domain-containing protein [Moraxella nasovis]